MRQKLSQMRHHRKRLSKNGQSSSKSGQSTPAATGSALARQIAEITGWDHSTIVRDLQKARGADAPRLGANAPAKPAATGSAKTKAHRIVTDIDHCRDLAIE